mmetsp:Transcript_1149/g.2561  ORF Transcript_1149/g.2561 Transcript_1149/m.2561 type:complete len:1361 (+) Transcript_1149:214-4296(+)
MGRFAHFVEKLSSPDPAERLKQIQEVCDQAGPRTYKKEEVGLFEKAIYEEPGILDAVVKMLIEGGETAAPAADCCFRMSRDNQVKSMMSTNSALLTAISTVCLKSPGTPLCNNVCLCLQNVSFPADTRVSLMNSANGCIVDGLTHVVSSPIDADHKTPRETSLAVLSNMAITPECKKGLFLYKDGKLLKTLIAVVNAGDKDTNNVLAREKALTLCKNLANHPETKNPMFEFEGLLDAIIGVLEQTLSASKTHKEVALQVFQNIANHDSTPSKMLAYKGLVASIVAVIASNATDNNEVARTNACLVLQNISFIESCRAVLYEYPGFFSALVGVLSCEQDTVKKNALPVLLNTSMATSIRKSMFDDSAFIPSLMVLARDEVGIVREKALSVLRNVANHESTKTPMFDYPMMIETLMSVVNLELADDTKLARETALAVIQNISNNDVNPSRLIAKEGLMKTLFNVFSKTATAQNKIARENSLLVCQNLSFPNTTRAPLFQFDSGRFFDAILDVMCDETNNHNKVASEKALATIANMSNKKENNLPMVKNERFVNKLVQLCSTTGEPKRHSINILAKIAAGALFTAPYLLKAPGNLLEVMMGVVRSAGTDLKKWKKGNSNEFWALTFLMNLAQAEFSVPYMRVANVTKLMAPLVSQTSKESLQASATVAYLVGGDEDGEIFDLLSTNLGSLDRIIELLLNTLNCKGDGKGEGGKNLDYGYGVFPLHSPLRAIKVLAKTDGFKDYLLDKGVFALLHRTLKDFVESTGGGYVGGGGDDVESASLAVEAMLELSYPSKATADTDKSYALRVVEKHGSADLTPVTRLLEQYETSYKVRTSEHFSSSSVCASHLMNRINLSSASKTTEMAVKMWEMATTKKDGKSKSAKGGSLGNIAMQKDPDAQRKIEEAANLLEKQRMQCQLDQEKRESDIRVLDQALKNEKDASQRKVVEVQKAIAERESAKSTFRMQDLTQQSNDMRELLRTMNTAQEELTSAGDLGYVEVKGTVKQALSSLDSFFPLEAPVPKYIMVGPPRGETLNRANLSNYMLASSQKATLHILCAHDLSVAVSFDINEPHNWVKEYASAIKLTLQSLRLVHSGAKNVASLPFPLPEGVSLDAFLASSSDQLASCFPLGSEGNEALKNIDIGGVSTPQTKEMTSSCYKKLATHFSNHDTGWARKLLRAMDKIRNKNGGEEWLSVRNLESYCEANEALEVEIVVVSPATTYRGGGGGDSSSVASMSMSVSPADFAAPTSLFSPAAPAAPLDNPVGGRPFSASNGGDTLLTSPGRSPSEAVISVPPLPPSAGGGPSSFAAPGVDHSRDIMSLRCEIAQLKSDVADLRREVGAGLAAVLEATRGQQKRRKSGFFG